MGEIRSGSIGFNVNDMHITLWRYNKSIMFQSVFQKDSNMKLNLHGESIQFLSSRLSTVRNHSALILGHASSKEHKII